MEAARRDSPKHGQIQYQQASRLKFYGLALGTLRHKTALMDTCKTLEYQRKSFTQEISLHQLVYWVTPVKV